MFMIIWDFLMVEQIFLSPQVERSVIISNKLVYTSRFTNCRTTYKIREYQNNVKTSYKYSLVLSRPRNENFVSTSKNLLKGRNWTFAVVRYFIWKIEFVENILWVIAGHCFFFYFFVLFCFVFFLYFKSTRTHNWTIQK